MLELGGSAGFALKALDHAVRPRDIGTQHLHGEAPLQVFVPHLVDLGEAARAD